MIINHNRTQSKIVSIIISNISILLIFLFWFFYSTFGIIINLVIICSSILTIVGYLLVIIIKKRPKPKNLTPLGILMIFQLFLLIDIIFSSIPNIQPFLFSFYNLFGIKHYLNIALFSFLSVIVIVKVIGIFLYFRLKPEVIKIGKGDEFFQYFTIDVNKKKKIFLLVLFPLSALVEESIYRSLFLSFLVYYFNFNLVIGILLASFLFVIVHFSASKDFGYIFSLVISSLIYFVSLIELGLLYAWLFHLVTNLFVLLFYYQTRKRKEKILPKGK